MIRITAQLKLMVTYIRFFYLVAVECQWNEWRVGDCNKSCGKGFRIKTRTPKSKTNGLMEDCSGPSTVLESCSIRECPGIYFYGYTLFRSICLFYCNV